MIDSVTQIAQQAGPFGLALLLIGCSYGLPLAKSLIIIAGGVLAGTGSIHPGLWFLGCALGLHFGDFSLFCIGRKWGDRVFEWRFVKRLVHSDHLEKATKLIQQHGTASLLLARITPFVRTACYLLIGTLGMKIRTFTVVNLSVSAIYAAVFFAIGFFLGNQPEVLGSWASSGNLILGIILFISALLLLRLPLAQALHWPGSKPKTRNISKL